MVKLSLFIFSQLTFEHFSENGPLDLIAHGCKVVVQNTSCNFSGTPGMHVVK